MDLMTLKEFYRAVMEPRVTMLVYRETLPITGETYTVAVEKIWRDNRVTYSIILVLNGVSRVVATKYLWKHAYKSAVQFI